MHTRITILCENTVGVPFGVIGEHGFACFVETDHGHYLFDTGQGQGLVANARILGKDLRSVAAVMVSHGHYDHTGGLPALLQARGPVDVHGHPEIFVERFWVGPGVRRFIGIPFRRVFLESLGARFRLGTELTEIGPGVFLTGEIPRLNAFETGDPHMEAIRPDGARVQPDPLKDDLSLILDTPKGLVLVLGCAHAGMINIMDYALKHMQRDRIYAVIGGTHLGFSSEAQFGETLAVIERYGIERLGVSHCTGAGPAARLHARLGERFFFGQVGAVLEA